MVEEVNNPGVTFAEGNAVDQFVDPDQVVYSFQGAGKARLPGNRHRQPRRNPHGGRGPASCRPAGHHPAISSAAPSGSFKVVVRDPLAWLSQETYPVVVEWTAGVGLAVNRAIVPRRPSTPSKGRPRSPATTRRS